MQRSTQRQPGRSPITRRGYGKGRTPPNKGRKLPAPVLSRSEVESVLDRFRDTRPTDVRDKTMLWLGYRHHVKVVQLSLMDTSHYDPAGGRLTVPATKRYPKSVISLDPTAMSLLDRWIAIRKRLGVRPFAPLFCATTADSLGRPFSQSRLRDKLPALGRTLGIHKRVTFEGFRASGKEHFAGQGPSVERLIENYVDEGRFRKRYPDAYDKWNDAQVLFRAGPVRYATQIGHNCREALAALASALTSRHSVDIAKGAGTVEKLRAVSRITTHSRTEREFLSALLAYWRSVSDLAQRQEHAGLQESEPPTDEDARRLIFQTLLVMYEVDRAIGQS
jgi:hypothetical protein